MMVVSDQGRRHFLATVAVAGLSACVASSARPLRFWAMGREAEVLQAILPDFQREYPHITVKLEGIPWSAAHEKLLTAYAGDVLPDLAQIGNTWLAEMDALHALAPLEQWLGPHDFAYADYFSGVLQTNQLAGRLLGIPWYVDTRLLFYRRDLLAQAGFAQPPSTWGQWTKMLAALQASGVANPILLPLNEFEPLLVLFLQQAGPLLREGGRYGHFQGAGFKQALDFYLQLFAKGWAKPAGLNDVANVAQEFGRGKIGFYLTGPWNLGEFRRRLPPELAGRWATAAMPGPAGPGLSVAGGSSLVIFTHSQRKRDAATLLAYLSRPEVQRRFYLLSGNLPPRRQSWRVPELAQDPLAAAFAQQLERVRALPQVPEWERIMQEMQQQVERMVRLRAESGPILRELDGRVDAILQKRRWMLDRGTR